jgi:hypothetical protein
VDPIGTWWRPDPVTGGYTRGQLRRTLYVQLRPEPSTLAGVPVVHVPVSLADRPVEGAINLAGRTFVYPDTYTYRLDYGIDALFVREGTGRPIESAIRDNDTPVYAEVLVTRSGTARVRALIINGQRTP